MGVTDVERAVTFAVAVLDVVIIVIVVVAATAAAAAI